MNKYLEQLVNLSNIDKDIDAFEPRLEAVSKALRQVEGEQENLQNTVTALEEEIKENNGKTSHHNIHLKELNDKLKDISKKSKSVKTEKEQKALNLEEEIAKEQIDFANEEIERIEKIIALKEDQLKDAQSALEEINSKIEESKLAISSEVEAVEKERNLVYAKKEKLVESMSQKILTFYEKIRKWAKNTAVVPVKKQACYGCFMRINDKTYSSVIRSEDIITCPHCGRILYKEIESEDKSA